MYTCKYFHWRTDYSASVRKFSIICFLYTFIVLKYLLLLHLTHLTVRHCLIASHFVWTPLELQIYIDITISYNFSAILKYQAGKQRQTKAVYLFLCESFNKS